MTKTVKISSLMLLAASLLVPALAAAQKPEGKSRGGGKAAQHRSDRAAERSNAQWQEDAKRGQDRAAEVRGKDGDGDEAEWDRDERREGGEKREKKRKKRGERAEGDEGREGSEDPRRERTETREGAEDPRRERTETRERTESSEASETTESTRDRRERVEGRSGETRERAAGELGEAERRTRREGEDSRGLWQRWFGDDEPAAR